MSGRSTVCVAVVGTMAEAQLIAGMLRDSGLPAAVSGDSAGGLDLALQSQGVRVMVAAADAPAARRMIDGASPDAEPARLNPVQRMIVRLLGGGAG